MQLDISSDPNFDNAIPPAPSTAWKEELARIVAFLNRDDCDSAKLWSVLSALRGPDTPDPFEVEKAATAAVIRHTIGLRMRGLVILPDSERSLVERKAIASGSSAHFYAHVANAFGELDLNWRAVNKSAEEAA